MRIGRRQTRIRMCRMKLGSALPNWLKAWWLCASPLAIVLAVRLLWEKTIWTWSRGPQMVGFSLMHIHPAFAVLGSLCAGALMIWLLPAIAYAVARRKSIGVADLAMVVCAAFVALFLVIPDNFFA